MQFLLAWSNFLEKDQAVQDPWPPALHAAGIPFIPKGPSTIPGCNQNAHNSCIRISCCIHKFLKEAWQNSVVWCSWVIHFCFSLGGSGCIRSCILTLRMQQWWVWMGSLLHPASSRYLTGSEKARRRLWFAARHAFGRKSTVRVRLACADWLLRHSFLRASGQPANSQAATASQPPAQILCAYQVYTYILYIYIYIYMCV